MSITSTADRIPYVGNGATTAFPFPYIFFAETDLVVIVSDSDGSNPVTKTLTTDYTVTGGNGSTGTVTFGTAPASGKLIDIYRWVQPTQGIDFLETGPLPAETLEDALDRLTMVDQQIISRIGGATFNVGSGEFMGRDSTNPLIWDAEGDRITDLGTPTAATDAVTKAYADAIVASAGNVPAPSDPADDGKVLTANGGLFSWQTLPADLVPTPADLADDGKHLAADSGAYILRTAAESRTDLGIGTVGTYDVGTSAGEIPIVGTSSATTTNAGLAELATNSEVRTGTDTLRVPPVSAMGQHASAIKAWCNFNGVAQTGTYSQTGTTVTVSITGHGLSSGYYAGLTYTTGAATNGFYQVTFVDVDTFTVTDPVSQSTSGNVTMDLYMRDGYNITSISDDGAGQYLIVIDDNFANTNYAMVGFARRNADGNVTGSFVSASRDDQKLSGQVKVRAYASGGVASDHPEINLLFIGTLT